MVQIWNVETLVIEERQIERTLPPKGATTSPAAITHTPIPTLAGHRPQRIAHATVSALATQNAYLKTQVAAQATSISPAAPFATPTPTGTPVASGENGQVSELVEPLLIDGEKGWIFASAQVDGQPKTVKLATGDGRLLAAYDVVGKLALDRMGERLFVDQGAGGIAVMDTQTDALLTTVTLPTVGPADADPQVDPTTGLAYVFRDKTIYVIDSATASVTQTLTRQLSIPSTVCGDPGEDASIARSFYDLVNSRLYLAFVTYVCTPWVTHTIVAYDAATLTELGRYQTGLNYQAVPYADSLYGTTAVRLGRNVSWAWNGYEAWFEEGGEARRLQGIVADWGRQLVYEALEGQIWAFKPYPRKVIGQVDVALLAGGGRLAGHDPISDQLFFLVNGQLEVHSTLSILAGTITSTPNLTESCNAQKSISHAHSAHPAPGVYPHRLWHARSGY